MSSEVTGIQHDEHFDITIDSTGDIGKVSGKEAAANDISAIVTRIIKDSGLGGSIGTNRKRRIESRLETAILDYEWTIDAEVWVYGNPREDTLEASILVLTSLGLIEDTIEV